MTKVLGLDLSTHTGFVLFPHRKGTPRFGTYRLPKAWNTDDYGARCWPLMEWLEGMIALDRPDVIAFEGPFLPLGDDLKERGQRENRFKTSVLALRLQISLAAIIETVAKKHGIRCLEVASASAKVALAGSARLKEKKLEMVRAAWARGWEVADDHQADAIGVALVVYSALSPDE